MFNNAKIVKDMAVKMERAIAASISTAAVMARNHFVLSFRNQGFTDETLKRWQPRKNEISGGIARVRRSRAILVQSGNLRNSIKASVRGNSIVISSDLPYAGIHNDGGNGLAWGRTPFTMTKRQFIGNSAVLNRKILGLLKRNIDTTFNR